MRKLSVFSRVLAVAPLTLAVSGNALASEGPSAQGTTPQSPSSQSAPLYTSPQSQGTQGVSAYPLPYGSSGPANLSYLGSPQAAPRGYVPPISTIPSPYQSSGPESLQSLGSPQVPVAASQQGGPGTVGTSNVQSPYTSGLMPSAAAGIAYDNANVGGTATAPFGGGSPNAAYASGLGGFGSGAASAFTMIGDAAPQVGRFATTPGGGTPPSPPSIRPPGPPAVNAKSNPAVSVRGFKIAENQSPVPQDRVFFFYNYYNNVNAKLNNDFSAPIKGLNIYRYTFGFEKTFNNGLGSFGLRLPINDSFALSRNRSLNDAGNSTALGNLSIFLKHVFYANQETGDVFSGGFAVSPRTAPLNFAGAKYLFPSNTTTFQPYFGYMIPRKNLYILGFHAFDFPVDFRQPTMMYNDLALGYFVYRDVTMENLVSAIAPTVEVHVNTPINHRGVYNLKDPYGTPNIVDLTAGVNFRFRDFSALTFGAVAPVTGPRPFSVEATVLLNIYYGRSRKPKNLPVIGS